MHIKCEVIAETPNDYESKTRGQVHEQVLSLIDRCAEKERITHAFDYVMTPEEERQHSGKLLDKRLTIAVTGFGEWMKTARLEGSIIEVDGKSVNGNGKPGALTPGSPK